MVDYEGDLPEGIVQIGEQEYLIQGKLAGSSYEVNYALALSNAGWQYKYLVGFWVNGRQIEIDFTAFTVPKGKIIFIDGLVWHSGDNAQRDKWERLQIAVQTRDQYDPPIEVFNPDCETYDAAWAHVIKNLGKH